MVCFLCNSQHTIFLLYREREKNIHDLKALRNQANNEASAADGKIGVARHHISVRKREIESKRQNLLFFF